MGEFEAFKAGWDAATKAVERERDNPARGWNSGTDNPILVGFREGLQTAVNTTRDGHADVEEAYNLWRQRLSN